MRGQLIELARDYAVEGLWLDITYIFPERCYCPFCRRLFRERTGREMPEQPAKGSAALAEVMAFRRWTRLDYLTDLTGAVRAFRGPDFPFTWNHAGCPDFAQVEPDRLSTLSAGEFHAPHYDEGFFKADWMRGFGKPYELMMPECLYGWGEWTVAPLPSMKTMGAIRRDIGRYTRRA